MKRPLLFFFFVCYTAAAIYSVGRTGSGVASPKAAFKTAFKPSRLVSNRVLLTTSKLPAMVQFYNEVFAADLQPVEPERAGVLDCQQGALSEVTFVLCSTQTGKPKTVLQRAPLRFTVSDLAEARRRVEAAGGEIENELDEPPADGPLTVRDPDGNLLELIPTSK